MKRQPGLWKNCPTGSTGQSISLSHRVARGVPISGRKPWKFKSLRGSRSWRHGGGTVAKWALENGSVPPSGPSYWPNTLRMACCWVLGQRCR
jgi:hypothetical protein